MEPMKIRLDSFLFGLLFIIGCVELTFVVGLDGRPPEREAEERSAAGRSLAAENEIATVGQAMFAWLTDQVGALSPLGVLSPVCSSSFPFDLTSYPTISHQDLEQLLVPTYLADLPEFDPWGTPYDYRLDTMNPLSSNVLAIRSAGSDGLFEGNLYSGGFTSGPDEDVVWAEGFFVRGIPRSGSVQRQDQTLQQMQAVGTAWLSWLVDQLGVIRNAPARDDALLPTGVDLAVMTPISHADLTSLLIPSASFFYIRCVPELDAWGHPFEFFRNDNLFATSNVLAIRSAGADGLTEGTSYATNTFPADDFHRDLVWADGFFVQSPDGQHQLILDDGFESGGAWETWFCID